MTAHSALLSHAMKWRLALLEMASSSELAATSPKELAATGYPNGELYRPDPEDALLLRGKSRGYIRGWNSVKRGSRRG